MTTPPPLERRDIFNLTYQLDENGNDILCYPDGRRYSGIVFEALPSGSLTAEYEVKNGIKDGVEIEYYKEGYPECQAHYREGLLHGDVTYYYASETPNLPKEKSVFEYDICTEEFAWAEDGTLLHHAVRELENFQRTVLDRCRKQYQW